MSKYAGRPAPKLTKAEMYDIILGPVITEKATMGSEHGQVTFYVRMNATKPEIKAAVEGIYSKKVTAVNTIRQKGKVKMFRGRKGRQNDRKKAIITLAEGEMIDLSTGA